MKGASKDPYAVEIDFSEGVETKKNDSKGKITGGPKAASKNPYSGDIDFNSNTKAPKLDHSKKAAEKKGGKSGPKQEIDEFIEEDIDDMAHSKDFHRDKDKKNPMFTSSEDLVLASQSQGFDFSVDSLHMEGYDYYEDAIKKRK